MATNTKSQSMRLVEAAAKGSYGRIEPQLKYLADEIKAAMLFTHVMEPWMRGGHEYTQEFINEIWGSIHEFLETR